MPVGYRVRIKGLEELQRKLEAGPKELKVELRRAMQRSVITVEGEVRTRTPVGVSGLLRSTVYGRVREAGERTTGAVGSGISSGEKYPAVMEFGRKAGAAAPPVGGRLMRWVQLRLHVSEEDLWRVTRAVAQGIARRGIKGRRMFREGFEKARTRVEGYFREAVRETVKKL